MKKTKNMAFSNGTSYMDWDSNNCQNCIKHSRYNEKTDTYSKYRCAIEKEIHTQFLTGGPISLRTYYVCRKWECPYKKTEWPKKKNKRSTDKNCYTLDL